MCNFFVKPAFHGRGLVSGFRDMDGSHASTFPSGGPDHLTIPGCGRDFSLETRTRLSGYNELGGLEQRTVLLDALGNS